MKKKVLAALLCGVVMCGLTACRESERVAYNISKEADNFNVTRRLEVINARTVKHIPPDTTAQIFWLKNRRPDRWRDKQQIEHSGTLEVENPLAGLTTEELRKLADDG